MAGQEPVVCLAQRGLRCSGCVAASKPCLIGFLLPLLLQDFPGSPLLETTAESSAQRPSSATRREESSASRAYSSPAAARPSVCPSTGLSCGAPEQLE